MPWLNYYNFCTLLYELFHFCHENADEVCLSDVRCQLSVRRGDLAGVDLMS